jgi:hypothetical protein
MRQIRIIFAAVIVTASPGCASYMVICEPMINQEYLDSGGDNAVFMSDTQLDCYSSMGRNGVREAIKEAKDECESGFADSSESDCRLYDINGIRIRLGHARLQGLIWPGFTDLTQADIAYRDNLDALPRDAGRLLSVGDPPLPEDCLDIELLWSPPDSDFQGLWIDVTNNCGVEIRAYVCIPYEHPKYPEKQKFWVAKHELEPTWMRGVPMDLSKYKIDKSNLDYRITVCPERRKCGVSCRP